MSRKNKGPSGDRGGRAGKGPSGPAGRRPKTGLFGCPFSVLAPAALILLAVAFCAGWIG